MTTRPDDTDNLFALPLLECSGCGIEAVAQLRRPKVRGRTVDGDGVTRLLPPLQTRAFVLECECGAVTIDPARRLQDERMTRRNLEHAEALGDLIVFTIDTSPTDELHTRRARALERWLGDVAAHARRLAPRVVRACLDEDELARCYGRRAIDDVSPMVSDIRRDLIAERLPR